MRCAHMATIFFEEFKEYNYFLTLKYLSICVSLLGGRAISASEFLPEMESDTAYKTEALARKPG